MSDSSIRKTVTQRLGHSVLLPAGWRRPRGYSNGIAARGETVYVGGMIGWDTNGVMAKGFVAQVRQTLSNVVAVVAEANGRPEHIVRMTWYVLDMDEYLGSLRELAPVYREVIGSHYPAMALVEVRRLVEAEARVEIEATAVIP